MSTIRLEELARLTYDLRWADCRSGEGLYSNAQDVARRIGLTVHAHKVTARHVSNLVIELRSDGKAPATINRKLAALSAMLTVARQQGMGPDQPVDMPRQREPAARQRVLTAEEQALLFSAFQVAPTPEDQHAGLLCRFLLETGMRRGEALTLRWPDFKAGLAHLRADATKTGRARRVPLTATASGIIGTLWYRSRGSCYLELDGPFRQLTAGSVRHAWDRAKKRAGLTDPSLVLHSLRHTAATRLIEANVALPTVQKILGHADIATTMRYTHADSDEVLKAAVARLEQA